MKKTDTEGRAQLQPKEEEALKEHKKDLLDGPLPDRLEKLIADGAEQDAMARPDATSNVKK